MMKTITIGMILAMASSAMPQTAMAVVMVSGGHDTVGADRGRPVSLVAGGLGLPDQVFRDAFSHVHPAPAGREPEPEQVRRNKDALLNALVKYGVTNDILDKVSDFYRYAPGSGHKWRSKAAVVEVVTEKDTITGFKIVSGGWGYSSAPTISVAGHPEIKATATILFSKDLSKNGSIAKIEFAKK